MSQPSFEMTPPRSLSSQVVRQLQGPNFWDIIAKHKIPYIETDVFIAGSGPIAFVSPDIQLIKPQLTALASATYARAILGEPFDPPVDITMAEIGAQDNPIIGRHFKNSLRYQIDFDSFAPVVKGALQPFSIPSIPSNTHISTLVGTAWRPSEREGGIAFQGSNPDQEPAKNLGAAAATRTVGGMATHWTCCCPRPHAEELLQNPISDANPQEFQGLLGEAEKILHVDRTLFDLHSIRHRIVKKALQTGFPERGIESLPLAVRLRQPKGDLRFRTWSAVDTILDGADLRQLRLLTEHRVTAVFTARESSRVRFALVRDINQNRDIVVLARAFILACGAICTPQILANSGIGGPALGRHLSEHSLAFCQVVMSKEIVESVRHHDDLLPSVDQHHEEHPNDPLPIPFNDFEPQVYVPYTHQFPHHGQVHRDAFSYGAVVPPVDCRVVVDLRFFGKQDVKKENRVTFAFKGALPNGDRPDPDIVTPKKRVPDDRSGNGSQWAARSTDIYGMPQVTFHVTRSDDDSPRDQKMMNDMTNMASQIGAYLPGSYPQFMEPGLAQHITGTTRIGTDAQTSVADVNSKVHAIDNLWVGGNGNIPDSMAANPTLTSMAIALKSARAVIRYLRDNPTTPKTSD